MNIGDIINRPTIIDNTHESVVRAYAVLDAVMEMVDRGDSKETIIDLVNFMRHHVKQ